MVPEPITYREFVKLVKSHGCDVFRKGSHGKVLFNGKFVCRFAVTHGKHTKGDMVLGCYVSQFDKNKP